MNFQEVTVDIHPWLQHKINKNINRRAKEKKKKINIENISEKKNLNVIKGQVNHEIVGCAMVWLENIRAIGYDMIGILFKFWH